MTILRSNFNTFEAGEEWLTRLDDESNRDFQVLLSLLSSYWQSTIDGPNYAREIKSMALALARIRLSLEDVQIDQSYALTRTEFLYQVLTSALFPGPGVTSVNAPDLQSTDVDFRTFLNNVITIYFAGSVPASISKAVGLLISGNIVIRENYLEARKPGSGFDISDEFGISIDIILPSPINSSIFLADKNIRILLSIIHPAHTLFNIKYIIQDVYVGQKTLFNPNKINDESTWSLSNYSYEDFRKFVDGIEGIDKFGFKKPIQVIGESHTWPG